MSLLSQFFPSTAGGANATGNFGSTLNNNLETFPVDVLLVGGGGGGGIVPSTKNAACPGFCDPNSAIGGGGGGGRLIQMLGAVVKTGTPYPITVGAGGAAGANGGATCFGSSLIAGGGGGAGTPGTFGRGSYELFDRTETSGSWGSDTIWTGCPLLMRVAAPSPSTPYFLDTDKCVYAGRRVIPCTVYSETTSPITYYDCVSPITSRAIYSEVNYNYPLGGDPAGTVGCNPFLYAPAQCCNQYIAGFSADFYSCCAMTCTWTGNPLSDCGGFLNAIFKKANHPAIRCSFFGLGGLSAATIQRCDSAVMDNTPTQGCGNFNRTSTPAVSLTNSISSNLKCFYAEGALNGCFPSGACYTSSCPFTCGPLYDAYGVLAPNGPSPLTCITSCTFNAELRAARGARAQFCPVSNSSIRAAMLLTNNYSLADHGPGLFTAPQCVNYIEGRCTPVSPLCNSFYPSTYESNNSPFAPFVNITNTGYATPGSAVQGRYNVTPGFYTVLEPQFSPCILRMRVFTPFATTSGVQTSGGLLIGCCFQPFLSATVSPVVDNAVWTAAENGTAGWGAGGGGGVNVSGIATGLVFRYQYASLQPFAQTTPAAAPWPATTYPGNEIYTTNAIAFGSCPIVCYSRYVGPSPAAVATGGSGGSGAVYIVYPTDYPAATVTGNTAVPSPPAYRVYYWTGNGSITFNQ